MNELLHDGDLLDGVPFHNLAGHCGFRLEQRRRTFDRDRFGDGAEFKSHVDAGLFIRTQYDARLDITS